MKKSLVALAALAVVGVASAQSSVTIFGIVDAAYAHTSGGGISRDGITNSGLNSSRLGFRGTEDLGGGMKAGFHLEGQLANDNGTPGGLNFLRRSFVSLTGGFGEVRIGREYSPSFWNTTIYDPFGTNGIGQSNGLAMLAQGGLAGNAGPVRNDNSVSYLMAASGVTVHAMYAFGEKASNVDDNSGDYLGVRVAYAAGPLDVGVSFANQKGLTGPVDVSITNLGVSYDLGMAKPMFQWGREKNNSVKISNWLLGVTVPVGQGEIRAAYSRYDASVANKDWNKLAVGYGYNLSKRTQLYGTLARVSNQSAQAMTVSNNGLAGSVSLGGKSSGYEFGVRHSF
ncbi:MAG: porin [Rhodoferax sp.]|nr:porin [Rhodoferax sp.]